MFARGRDSSVPVPKCPRDISALVPNCPDGAERVRSVLTPVIPYPALYTLLCTFARVMLKYAGEYYEAGDTSACSCSADAGIT